MPLRAPLLAMTSWNQLCFPEAVIGSTLFHWLGCWKRERAGGSHGFCQVFCICSQYFTCGGSCVPSTISLFQSCLFKQLKIPQSFSERKKITALLLSELQNEWHMSKDFTSSHLALPLFWSCNHKRGRCLDTEVFTLYSGARCSIWPYRILPTLKFPPFSSR